MSERDDGGPAFPGPTSHDSMTYSVSYPGMSLRDYFASTVNTDERDEDFVSEIKAAFIGRACPSWQSDPKGCLEWHAEWRAAWRYMQADAMLEARKK